MPRFMAFLLVAILLISGCTVLGKEKTVKFEDLTATPLDEIHSIEVRYGDGKLLTISDPDTVQTVISKLTELRLQYVADMPDGVGYCYFLKFGSSPEDTYLSTLFINGKQYKSMNGVPKELDALILAEGRKKYPDLLPEIVSP
ncbi:hypothetical protein [Gorillibacterium massiliense]|uniref:hypothetical protein n=1 Tax=Gorillibacterium massiliense TaxID=1280390 RepID=UPI0004BAB050|nr:hypothetical protein [Gorillibacterium massiliense]